MDIEVVKKLDELFERATAKPWNPAPYRDDAEAVTVAIIGDWRVEHPTPGIKGGNYRDTKWGNNVDDANLIAALVNSWPQIRASLEVGRVSVPEGWKLVPVSPTDDMIDAAVSQGVGGASAWRCYKLMLEAASVRDE